MALLMAIFVRVFKNFLFAPWLRGGGEQCVTQVVHNIVLCTINLLNFSAKWNMAPE